MSLGIHPRLENGELSRKNAAFIAFIANDVPHYADAPASWGVSNKKITLLGMVSRWDSTQGFVGGMVDEGETIEQAALRECIEEVGYTVDPSRLHLVCTHKASDVLNTHMFACSVTREELYDIQKSAFDAEHSRIEAGAFIVHHIFADSFQNLIESSLAKTVREELFTLDQLNYL